MTPTLETLNPTSPEHTHALTHLFTAYLTEELNRTGDMPLGLPAAAYLRTILIRTGPHITGFCAIDPSRYAVELIYVRPAHRRQGHASGLLTALANTCPQPMLMKPPLTPASERLAAKLGLGLTEPGPEEAANAEAQRQTMRRGIAQHCRHRRRGNPALACSRCYRRAVARFAQSAVTAYVLLTTGRPPSAAA